MVRIKHHTVVRPSISEQTFTSPLTKNVIYLSKHFTFFTRLTFGINQTLVSGPMTCTRDMIPNNILYGDLPKLTDKIRERRLKLAGHCYRHPELVAQKLTLWRPQQGNRSRGGRTRDYVDTLLRGTETEGVGELSSLMADRVLWKKLSRIRVPRDPA